MIYDDWEPTTRSGSQQLNGCHWRSDLCNRGACIQSYPKGTNTLRAFCAIHIIVMIAESNSARLGIVTGATNICQL